MKDNKKTAGTKSFESRNLLLTTLISILLSVQVLVAIACFYSFFPIEVDILPELHGVARVEVRPEREMFFYRIFVFTLIGLQALAIRLFRKKFVSSGLYARLWRFARVEAVLVGVMLFALYKMAVYNSPPLAKALFGVAFSAAIISKIFWKEVEALCAKGLSWFNTMRPPRWSANAFDVGVPLFIITVLLIPDPRGALAKVFLIDQLWHWDSYVMAPGWAYLKGATLNVDVWSQYGIGQPVLMTRLSQIFGDFSFETVFTATVVMGALYVILCYVFLRLWVGNPVLAAAGTLLILRIVYFGHGADYFVWRTPSGTPMRYWFDIFFISFLWLHVKYRQKIYLILSAIFVGVSIAYISDTGVYTLVALYAYLVMPVLFSQYRSALYREPKDALWIAGYAVTPLITAAVILNTLIGPELWKSTFWDNIIGYLALWKYGFGLVPIHWNLQNDQIFNFFKGIFVGLVYIFTLVRVGSLVFLKKEPRETIFVVVLAVYGLTVYHYFVNRSIASSYFGVGVPFCLILVYWFQEMIKRWDDQAARKARGLGLVIVILGLFTTHSFLVYPNAVNLVRLPLDKEKLIMAQHIYHEKDVQLIRRLTKPEDKVCLFSSWEIMTLIAADRKPMWYYFNLFYNRSMRQLTFGGFRAWSDSRFARTFNQLKNERPEIVFIEYRLQARKVPREQFQYYELMSQILDYLDQNYTPAANGHYLVALERNEK